MFLKKPPKTEYVQKKFDLHFFRDDLHSYSSIVELEKYKWSTYYE